MGWFNYYGLAVLVVILIPNVIFAVYNKNGFENVWHNKFVEIAEQTGRFSCFVFMIFNIPKMWFGFWFKDALTVYLVVNGVLVTAYCVIWAVCFKKTVSFARLRCPYCLPLCLLSTELFYFPFPLLLQALYSPRAISFCLIKTPTEQKNKQIS